VLRKITNDRTLEVCLAAHKALEKLHTADQNTVAVLRQAAQDPVKDIREAAQKALKGYRTVNKAIIE
jgi:HEAT repeat protein